MSVALAFTASGCAAAQQPPKVPPSADASQSETKTDKEKIMPESYPSDLQQLAQMTIDLDILAKYFHPELPGRKPLRLLKNTVVSDDLALTKFGEPVRWVSADEAKKGGAVFEISKIDIRGATATVSFSYAIEGLRGTATFRKTNNIWRTEDRELREQ
jgi:hypothetical protein